MKKIIAILAAFVLCTAVLTGCSGKKYNVDHSNIYAEGIKDSYRAGRTVKFTVAVPTDTNYSLYVDGEYLSGDYKNGEVVYMFTMPRHDVVITCTMENTMVYIPYDISE